MFTRFVNLCQGLRHKRIINTDTIFEVKETTGNKFEYFQQQKHIHNGLIFFLKNTTVSLTKIKSIKESKNKRQPFREKKYTGNILKSAII